MSVYLAVYGAINGQNTAFTMSALPDPSYLELYKNGQLQPGADYSYILNRISWLNPSTIPNGSDSLIAITDWATPIPSNLPANPNLGTGGVITVRALSVDGDPMRGNGLANFLGNIDAVGQIIATRLKLLAGEVFWNVSEGTPLFQSLLGVSTNSQAVALILRNRILGTPYVTGISSLVVKYGPAGRTFAFSAVVQTAFGALTVGNAPSSQTFGGANGTWGTAQGTWGGVQQS